jgi:hypothetical protein
LVAYGTSRDINPSLPQSEIDRELETDPIRNRAEYLSEWRDDTAGFIGRDVVEAGVGDYRELEPRPGVLYFCFVDAASGTDGGDSYAIAIAHKDGDQTVINVVREIVPPFSPTAAVTDVAVPLCKQFRIEKFVAIISPANMPRSRLGNPGSIISSGRSTNPTSTPTRFCP